MSQAKSLRNEKLESPATTYENPRDIVKDIELSRDEKAKALNTWEQDARQLMTASNEGMPGPEEGRDPQDRHRLGEVVRAKYKIGETPNHKPSQ
jgi:hypothetical protein